MGRGQLTDRANEIAQASLGRKITQQELRLLPYIQYCMMNEQTLRMEHISREEREILSKWREEGLIDGGASGLSITKDFWNFMSEILFETYVDYER